MRLRFLLGPMAGLLVCVLPHVASAAECALPDADQQLQDTADQPQCDRFAYESPLWVDLLGDEPLASPPPAQSPAPSPSNCELGRATTTPGTHLAECPSVNPTARRAAAIARARSRLNPPVRSHRAPDGVADSSDACGTAPPPAPMRSGTEPLAVPARTPPPQPAIAQAGWPEAGDREPPEAPSARLERPPRA